MLTTEMISSGLTGLLTGSTAVGLVLIPRLMRATRDEGAAQYAERISDEQRRKIEVGMDRLRKALDADALLRSHQSRSE